MIYRGEKMHRRVLIVGTVPYNKKSPSRAFDAYFHNWEKENLAQIFSNTKIPCKGHCAQLYQITDQRVLRCFIGKREETGKIFYYDDLPEEWSDNYLEVGDKAAKAYRLGAKHSSLTHLLRGLLWQKRFWCTEQLDQWLDDFRPECVFLAFSDDYFILKIALYVAGRFGIPIVSCIGDDYYFNKHFSVNPFYLVYKNTYRALVRKVLSYPGSAIYISDKIRDKYNKEFGLSGDTVYLSSEIRRRPFLPLNTDHPLITYFGNIRMGRNRSLCNIADSLTQIDPSWRIEVYSNEGDPKYYQMLEKNPGVIYGGSVPYSEVKEKMTRSDITVIVEGFAKKDVDLSRYSLSTKAADALASGCAILVYGSAECGIVEYMSGTGAAMVCTERDKLTECIKELIADDTLRERYYEQQILISKEHHTLARSCETSERIIDSAIERGIKVETE